MHFQEVRGHGVLHGGLLSAVPAGDDDRRLLRRTPLRRGLPGPPRARVAAEWRRDVLQRGLEREPHARHTGHRGWPRGGPAHLDRLLYWVPRSDKVIDMSSYFNGFQWISYRFHVMSGHVLLEMGPKRRATAFRSLAPGFIRRSCCPTRSHELPKGARLLRSRLEVHLAASSVEKSVASHENI